MNCWLRTNSSAVQPHCKCRQVFCAMLLLRHLHAEMACADMPVLPRFCHGFGAWAEEGSPGILKSAIACFFQRCLVCLVLGNLLLLPWVSVQVHAETTERGLHPRAGVVVPATLPTRIDGWIARFQHAARSRSYVGILIVSTSDGTMSSARITHACSDKK